MQYWAGTFDPAAARRFTLALGQERDVTDRVVPGAARPAAAVAARAAAVSRSRASAPAPGARPR
ncbi:hypothetical protein GCM10010123_44500 [Pilimelia anulata]|uniref:Uncharacterized protein n=1 Tax=Pilimelia anulata TaxID=53371 RepID=A0A8J3FDD7_9ACTN|nr:hypothetical protein GCM10010123_44500 [Pilimelia anulata]